MAKYPIQQPPNGYGIVFDAETERYFPLCKVSGEGDVYWDCISDASGKPMSYVKRVDAVQVCIERAKEDKVNIPMNLVWVYRTINANGTDIRLSQQGALANNSKFLAPGERILVRDDKVEVKWFTPRGMGHDTFGDAVHEDARSLRLVSNNLGVLTLHHKLV
jgi:hypothetical protein